MVRLAGLFLAVLLAVLFLLPAPCLAAEPIAAPAAKSAPKSAAKAVLDPDMDEGHRQFAHANYEKALEHYLKALERNKEDAYLYFRVGMAYYMLGDDDTAHDNWKKAYTLDSTVSDKYMYEESGKCMFKTLLRGDIFYVDNKHYDYMEIKHGDVILYYVTTIPDVLFAGRVIGLGNNVVEIINNNLYINNKKIIEEYVSFDDEKSINFLETFKKTRIKNNEIFVLCDSRNWNLNFNSFLMINKDLIFGKLLVIMDSKEMTEGQIIRREDRLGMVIK